MKKFKKISLAFMVAIMALVGVAGSAGAATGATGACGVKVWNDYSQYASWSTTVDYQISKPSSQCGTVYYKATVYQLGDGMYSTGYGSTGYFSYSTPVKYFYIDSLKKQTPYPSDGYNYKIIVNLYSDSARTNYIGKAESLPFNIPN